MQQVKIFKSTEQDVESLEKDINEWLDKAKVRVNTITGNIAPQSATADPQALTSSRGFTPSDILVIILYEPR